MTHICQNTTIRQYQRQTSIRNQLCQKKAPASFICSPALPPPPPPRHPYFSIESFQSTAIMAEEFRFWNCHSEIGTLFVEPPLPFKIQKLMNCLPSHLLLASSKNSFETKFTLAKPPQCTGLPRVSCFHHRQTDWHPEWWLVAQWTDCDNSSCNNSYSVALLGGSVKLVCTSECPL